MAKNIRNERVRLRYTGPSAIFVDQQLDLRWEAGVDVHEVGVEDAARLSALPFEYWEVYTAVTEQAEKKAAEDAYTAQLEAVLALRQDDVEDKE